MAEPLTMSYELTDAILARVVPGEGLSAKFLRAVPGVLAVVAISAIGFGLNEWWAPANGPMRWLFGDVLLISAGTLVLMTTLQAFAVWVCHRHRRELRTWSAGLTSRTICWAFAEHEFRVTSSYGERAISWADVETLREGEEFWTFFLSGRRDLFVPAERLTPDMRSFIRGRLKPIFEANRGTGR